MTSTNNKALEMTKEIVIAMMPNSITYFPDNGNALQIVEVFETIYNKVLELYNNEK